MVSVFTQPCAAYLYGMSQLTFSLVQTNLHWENKQANLEMLQEKINSIDKTEVVILPEMFSTGFSMKPAVLAERMDGPTMQWMADVSASKKIILTGSFIAEEEGKYFNRLVWMQPNGQYGYYDKRHLFGYAGEDQNYAAGNKRLIASAKGFKINLLVCYDLRFPVWARQHEQPGNEPEFDVVMYVANWPERRSHAWRTLLQARAIENQCFVIGVNRVGNDGNGIYHAGHSMVVDSMGEVLFEHAHEEIIHTIILHKQALDDVRQKLPFLKDRDTFHIDL
jgi:omega-amidase